MPDKTVLEGEMAEFTCSVNQRDAPVSWYLGSLEIKPSDRLNITATGEKRCLIINYCQLSDGGIVRARTGDDNIEAKLTVLGLDFVFLYIIIFLSWTLFPELERDPVLS